MTRASPWRPLSLKLIWWKNNSQQTIITNRSLLKDGLKCNTYNIHILQKEEFPAFAHSFNQRTGWCMTSRMKCVHKKELINKYFIHTKQQPSSFHRIGDCHPPQHYDDRMDCRAICCWGCKEDHVEARVAGGNVCWSCLSKLIIRLAVCSVARSLPVHRTYRRSI